MLDEADKLLNMDFEKDINQILGCLPKKRTTFLYSATMTNKVSKLQRVSLVNPVKCKVSAKYKTVTTLKQYYIFVPQKYKDCNLVYLLNEMAGQKIMVFCNTCMNSMKYPATYTLTTTSRICLMLRNLGFQAVVIHGQMSQVKRMGALNKFKAKKKNILIATEVAAR